jgi:hypothetical protein
MIARESSIKRIFGAICFFPPDTDPNSLSAYKLLRNSRHNFDICSSKGLLEKAWAYPSKTTELQAPNINLHQIPVKSALEWADSVIDKYFELSQHTSYDAILTWYHPVESIAVAQRLNESGVKIPWFAMVCDPIGYDPDFAENSIDNNTTLSEGEKRQIQSLLRDTRLGLLQSREEEIRVCRDNHHECMLIRAKSEHYMYEHARGIAFCSDALAEYTSLGRRRDNIAIIPLAYDSELFLESLKTNTGRLTKSKSLGGLLGLFSRHRAKTIRHIGNLSEKRFAVIIPLLDELSAYKERNNVFSNKIVIEFYGNVPESFQSYIDDRKLSDIVRIKGELSQLEALALATEADWLLHIDLNLPYLAYNDGSIYFPSKLADYLGTDKPIMSITGHKTPSGTIVKRCGGVIIDALRPSQFTECLIAIVLGSDKSTIDIEARGEFDAKNVSKKFDTWLEC